MLQGIRNRACTACWHMEDSGGKSDRQIKNETLDFYFDKDLEKLFDMCVQGDNYTAHYKIDSSNVCNSTCVTCNSEFSSAWGDLERKNGVNKTKNWMLKTESFKDDIDFKRARSIGFRGGEPLLSSTNFDILEQLIEHNNTQCFINFTTNGSMPLTQRQKNILSRFPNINMCVSIDGTGKVFEYIRYPLSWSTLQQNLDYFRQQNMMLSVSYTISNLNVVYHHQTCAWFEQNNLRYHKNPVAFPRHFRPAALPRSVKQQLRQQQDPVIDWLLGTHDHQDDVDYLEFRRQTAQQDAWKGIKMSEYLPELTQLLG